MPALTLTLYPRGDRARLASWDDALSGLPILEPDASLDYLHRLRHRRDLDDPDHGWIAMERAPRVEYPDVDP